MMQANRQILIWAGIGILIVAGLVVFVLVTNQPQSPSDVAANTSVPADEADAEETDEIDEEAPEEETPEAENGEEADGEPVPEDADAEETDEAAATPTSMSRVTQSIPIGTEVTPALEGVPQSQTGEQANGAATPTSMSRVTQSITLDDEEELTATPSD